MRLRVRPLPKLLPGRHVLARGESTKLFNAFFGLGQLTSPRTLGLTGLTRKFHHGSKKVAKSFS
jgi:hypothetical protein